MNNVIDPSRNATLIAEIGTRLAIIETEFQKAIAGRLTDTMPGRDVIKCNAIFGIYTHAFLKPCIASGLASRAATIGSAFINAVLGWEKKLSMEFHKGALFHDVAIAHFISGNVDEYEYLLAMADEENFKSSGASGNRGTLNLQIDDLTRQTITERMQLTCDLLNGGIAGNAAHYAFLVGLPPITLIQLDAWRQKLDSLEQFEYLRIIHDFHEFLGIAYPDYATVKDNPFVMLRLAKVLTHLAQWIESILTRWQGGGGGSLSPKLKQDADFGSTLSAAAGNQELFAGNCPHGINVDTELNRLLAELLAEPQGSPRHWRLLRILYIVRNSTAHTIDSTLGMYNNRAFLLNLIQVVFVSIFVICQLKAKPMP